MNRFVAASSKYDPVVEVLTKRQGYEFYAPDRSEANAIGSLDYYTETSKADCYSDMPPVDLAARLKHWEHLDVEDVRRKLASDVYVGVDKDLAIAYVVRSDLNLTTNSPFLECNTYEELVHLAMQLMYNSNRDSVPGYPYNLRHADIGKLLDSTVYYDGFVDAERVAAYAAFTVVHCVLEHDVPIGGAVDGLRRKIASYNQLIVKFEPHPVRKDHARIVIGMPIHFQIADQMLMQIDPPAPGSSSLMYGWGNHFGDDLSKAMAAVQQATGGEWVKSDVKGWERRVTARSLCWAEAILCLVNDNCDFIMPTMHNRALALANAVYMLRNGIVICKTEACLQVSGQFLTTAHNGVMRSSFAVSNGGRAFCNGDDCLELTKLGLSDLMGRYNAVGLEVRDVENCTPNKFEFSSHEFVRDGFGKMTYRHVNPQKSVVRQLGAGKNFVQTLHVLAPNFSNREVADGFIADLRDTRSYLLDNGYDLAFPTQPFIDALWSDDNSAIDERLLFN